MIYTLDHQFGWVEKIDMEAPCRQSTTHRSERTAVRRPLIADHCNYYKIEKWMRDGSKVDHLLHAGSDLEKARKVFAAAVKQSAADPADYPAADAGAGALAGVGAVAAEGPKRQTIGALSRRSFRRSIQFQVLACAGLWRRRSPTPLCTARSIVADVR